MISIIQVDSEILFIYLASNALEHSTQKSLVILPGCRGYTTWNPPQFYCSKCRAVDTVYAAFLACMCTLQLISLILPALCIGSRLLVASLAAGVFGELTGI